MYKITMYSPCLLTRVYLILGTQVQNWSISRDDKVKLTKYKNHHHHRGAFDMWIKWARPQAEWEKGPAGRPNSLAGQPGFEVVQPTPWLPCGYTRRRSPSRWRLLHPTSRPATTWRQIDLSKSVEVPFTP
jgi:hypothetical protein